MKKLIAIALGFMTLVGCVHQGAQSSQQLGTVNRDTILDVPCQVYMPYDYMTREDIFPVLYLQHGMWGNEDDWIEKGNFLSIMDTLLQSGAVKEMVVIMPDNCPGRPTYEQEKADATDGHWEENFAQFMAEAESKYRISDQPSQRAIAGLSMGGYHTMMVSSLWNGQFAYAGMFSPATMVHCMPSEPTLLWIAIGKEDFLYDSLQEYRQWLEQMHREYTYYESTGGHDWPNWQDYLYRFLSKCAFKI